MKGVLSLYEFSFFLRWASFKGVFLTLLSFLPHIGFITGTLQQHWAWTVGKKKRRYWWMQNGALSRKATGGVFTIGHGFSPPVTMTCTYCRRWLHGRTHFVSKQLFCVSTHGIECSTNTRQVLTQFNEAAVYVGVSYVEEKEDFIQQVVICCYPSPARPVYICTIIVSCWSVHIHVWSSFEQNGRPYGCFGLLYVCVCHYTEVIWALIYEWASILKWILMKLNLLPPQWSEFLWSWICTLKLQCIQFWKKKISGVSTDSWSFRFKFLLLITSTKKQQFWCQ